MAENKRQKCSLERFFEVTIVKRDQYPTIQEAAAATGLTPLSFQQRLVRERKRYPNQYKDIKGYRVGGGQKIASESEAAAILERLQSN